MPLLRKATKKAANRLHILADRGRFESDLDDEMRFHLEMEAARNVERGMSPGEAGALARREFGQIDRFKDEVRDARGVTWLDDLRRDLRFGLRSLRRSVPLPRPALRILILGPSPSGRGRALRRQDCAGSKGKFFVRPSLSTSWRGTEGEASEGRTRQGHR
jgi:hypothetical protein